MSRRKFINIAARDIKGAVEFLLPYLLDTREPNEVIYLDGWHGLGGSAVLTSIAEHPPPALRSQFDKIIHIDSSSWTNRRALQRTIAQKLGLPRHVMDIFDRQDEEEDFVGADEGSRAEIEEVGREIYRALQGQRCLSVFHNGSDSMVDLNDFGIPRADKWSNTLSKVLWTDNGRLRRRGHISGKYDRSNICMEFSDPIYVDELICEEAKVIARYTSKQGVTPEIAAACCKYFFYLNYLGIEERPFNWVTHASNYWVCDGIIQEGQQDKAWEVATALHQEIWLKDPLFGKSTSITGYYHVADVGLNARWITDLFDYKEIKPETTSFFFLDIKGIYNRLPRASLRNNMFQRSDQLHVLKLFWCTFSFSSPPFLHCRNIRFLGLDSCQDQSQKAEQNKEEEEKDDRPITEFFQSLWVLDICLTDWRLPTSSPNVIEKMSANIREVNVERGSIWHNNFVWRRLQNLHKLRVVEPTVPWQTGCMDDFKDMGKLELLDLSGNETIEVLPSFSGAINLSTLVLDGCIGLRHVGPEILPPSLETFSLCIDPERRSFVGRETRICRISLAGCTRLVNFRLLGPFPNLEMLDLSNTSVKILDLRGVEARCLQQIIFLGCEELRAVLWPRYKMQKHMVLYIDTRGGTKASRPKTPHQSLVSGEREEGCSAFVSLRDIRFLQSLVQTSDNKFCWITSTFSLNLCLSSIRNDDGQTYSKKMDPYNIGQSVGSLLRKSSIPKSTGRTYSDADFDKATIGHDGSCEKQFRPLDVHVEIGEGISNINMLTAQGIRAVIFLMNEVKSLLVHDNSSITTVIPQSIMSVTIRGEVEEEKETITFSSLKWCCIERCPRLDSVFDAKTNHDHTCFPELHTFWAADLLMARCIWSKGWPGAHINSEDETKSFAKLRVIHLHSCPRLRFVLELSWFTLSSLETLCIICCGELSRVFPVEAESEKQFPQLKHIYLFELPNLQQICDAKMFAPKIETIMVRGCWNLKRLPATADRPDGRPAVYCEKEWWKKLEWDGKEAGHHPSLFKPRHSKYHKKTLIKGSVLR
ncbi:hypothetical protein ACP70R_018043 [Stipagrostis hirtigluma subsp. patula]